MSIFVGVFIDAENDDGSFIQKSLDIYANNNNVVDVDDKKHLVRQCANMYGGKFRSYETDYYNKSLLIYFVLQLI